jgi:exonuclease VII small subunit
MENIENKIDIIEKRVDAYEKLSNNEKMSTDSEILLVEINECNLHIEECKKYIESLNEYGINNNNNIDETKFYNMIEKLNNIKNIMANTELNLNDLIVTYEQVIIMISSMEQFLQNKNMDIVNI